MVSHLQQPDQTELVRPLAARMTLDELRALATIQDGPHRRFQPPYQQMSVSLDEAELLYALVRALKPRNVLELGTGLGLSGRFMWEAGTANERSGGDAFTLVTVEPDGEIAEQAVSGLLAYAVGRGVGVQGLPPHGNWRPELVYIDSRQSDRRKNIGDWLTNGYKGLVLVHDAERQYPEINVFGEGVYLPTANGMWLGRAK